MTRNTVLHYDSYSDHDKNTGIFNRNFYRCAIVPMIVEILRDQLSWVEVSCHRVRFLKLFKGFLKVFKLQMSDTKLRPSSTMKSKNKSSEQRFGHVNATNLNSYLNIIIFMKLVTQ